MLESVLNGKPFRNIKNCFPFSLGTTSYIVPDEIIPNVRLLAPVVDDIELVLFESGDISNIPSHDDIRELSKIAEEFNTSFTIHLPIDKHAGAESYMEREMFVDAAVKIIERCNSLSPAAWILHLEGISVDAQEYQILKWRERCLETIDEIKRALVDPSMIAVENLGYPWYWHESVVGEAGLSLCCDVGHLWMCFHDKWRDHLQSMLPQTTVIHLHGFSAGKDHISLFKTDRGLVNEFLEMVKLAKYNGIITLEIFSETDLIESVEVISKVWED